MGDSAPSTVSTGVPRVKDPANYQRERYQKRNGKKTAADPAYVLPRQERNREWKRKKWNKAKVENPALYERELERCREWKRQKRAENPDQYREKNRIYQRKQKAADPASYERQLAKNRESRRLQKAKAAAYDEAMAAWEEARAGKMEGSRFVPMVMELQACAVTLKSVVIHNRDEKREIVAAVDRSPPALLEQLGVNPRTAPPGAPEGVGVIEVSNIDVSEANDTASKIHNMSEEDKQEISIALEAAKAGAVRKYGASEFDSNDPRMAAFVMTTIRCIVLAVVNRRRTASRPKQSARINYTRAPTKRDDSETERRSALASMGIDLNEVEEEEGGVDSAQPPPEEEEEGGVESAQPPPDDPSTPCALWRWV